MNPGKACPLGYPVASPSPGPSAQVNAPMGSNKGADCLTLPEPVAATTTPVRISSTRLARISRELSDRERSVLVTVQACKLVSAGHLQVLHFPVEAHATALTAARTCRRTLERLTRLRALTRLQRRIGGLRAGSAAFIYTLGPVGERLLNPAAQRRKRREPSAPFAAHTLAITDAFVELSLAARARTFELVAVTHEPGCWRSFTGPSGANAWIKPDLAITLGAGDQELSWFLEIDLGTEHTPALRRKAEAYLAAYHSGAVTVGEGVFPRVLWLAHDAKRATLIRSAMPKGELSEQLFAIAPAEELLPTVLGAHS